jgi:hypothetical protein
MARHVDRQTATDFWADADVIYSYTWQQAVEDGMLVEIFKDRWPELSGGMPLLATRGTFEAFSLAALMEMWNDFVAWAKAEDRVFGAIFETRMNGQRVWVSGDGETFTILFPHEN